MPAGRPTKLNQPVGERTTADNKKVPLTAGQVVVERIQLGLSVRDACRSADIDQTTLAHWRREGGAALAKQAQRRGRLTQRERQYAQFLLALERAETEAELRRLAVIERAAAGGAVVTRTVEKRDANGTLLERTTTTETLRPEWTAAAWWLERKRWRDYGRRRVELTGAEGRDLIPSRERADNIADALEGYLAAQGEGDAVEAEVLEPNAGGLTLPDAL